MAILNRYLHHHTVNHATKFQADSWNLLRVKAVTSSLGPGPSLFWKFQSSVERAKFGHFKQRSAAGYCTSSHQITGQYWNLHSVRAVTSSLRPGQKSPSWKNSVEHAKIGRSWPWKIAVCPMVPCIISSNFKRIAEILKELERERRSGWTDGQVDGWTAGRLVGRMTDDNTRRLRWRLRAKLLQLFVLCILQTDTLSYNVA